MGPQQMQRLRESNRTPRLPAKDYFDGCTLGPSRFGRVYHTDICDLHDIDWLLQRTALGKAKADFRWWARITRRHAKNTPYQPFALTYGVIGFFWLMTAGWFFWAFKGPKAIEAKRELESDSHRH